MSVVITGKCTNCGKFRAAATGVGRRYRICKMCASDSEVIKEKQNAARVTKEIREGLPGLFADLRREANNERK
jgi:methylphosphotriester-DNA--protein-cysteine methyltransferase